MRLVFSSVHCLRSIVRSLFVWDDTVNRRCLYFMHFVNAIWNFTHWSFIQKEARSWQSLVTYIIQGWFCTDRVSSPHSSFSFSLTYFNVNTKLSAHWCFSLSLVDNHWKKKFVDFFIKSISNLLEVIPLYTPVKTDKTLGVVVKVYELPVSFLLEKKCW